MIRKWIQRNRYLIKASAPYTQTQNKGAKKSRGVIKNKARAIIGKLPKELWPRIYQSVMYLWN